MYRLMVNDRETYSGTSLFMLLRAARNTAYGDRVEIWHKARTQWRLVDGGVWQ